MKHAQHSSHRKASAVAYVVLLHSALPCGVPLGLELDPSALKTPHARVQNRATSCPCRSADVLLIHTKHRDCGLQMQTVILQLERIHLGLVT